LSSNSIGRAVKLVGSFIQNTLSYGSKRPKRRSYGIERYQRLGDHKFIELEELE
jgi:hypothetical protein